MQWLYLPWTVALVATTVHSWGDFQSIPERGFRFVVSSGWHRQHGWDSQKWDLFSLSLHQNNRLWIIMIWRCLGSPLVTCYAEKNTHLFFRRMLSYPCWGVVQALGQSHTENLLFQISAIWEHYWWSWDLAIVSFFSMDSTANLEQHLRGSEKA